MLAGSGLPTTTLDHWAVEPKLDGWRALVSVEGGRLRVRTRRGRDITDVVPELASVTACGHDLRLDGELYARGGRMADFAGLSGRLAGRPKATSLRVSLVVFDVLWLDGVDLMRRPYEHRRRALLELVGMSGPSRSRRRSSTSCAGERLSRAARILVVEIDR